MLLFISKSYGTDRHLWCTSKKKHILFLKVLSEEAHLVSYRNHQRNLLCPAARGRTQLTRCNPSVEWPALFLH